MPLRLWTEAVNWIVGSEQRKPDWSDICGKHVDLHQGGYLQWATQQHLEAPRIEAIWSVYIFKTTTIGSLIIQFLLGNAGTPNS